MATLEQLARAALGRDSLQLRSLAQDFLRENDHLSDYSRPEINDVRILGTAAALIELFALCQKQAPPSWTQDVGPLPEPFFLRESAEKFKRLRAQCETQAPEPLRKRHLYAPPNFLEFA